ncbi:uncharacterized protein LOC144564698 isoform X2 [Carex rostrata]
MLTGEDPFVSGTDGINRMVTGEEPFASRANGGSRMGTDEAPQSLHSRTRARIEVFSAVMEDKGFKPSSDNSKPRGYRHFFGVIFLHICGQDFVIFDAEALQLPQINSEGHVTLSGLRCSIPVKDEIVLYAWFFDHAICAMRRAQSSLWEAKSDYMDRLICQSIKCFSTNYLDVSFAVYHDAVEAHLDVYFVDFEYEGEDVLMQVHGTVSASNSFLTDSKAKSNLFHKLSKECVGLKPGKLVPLPLSRRVTAVPRQSSLLVNVSINVGIEPGNVLVIEKTVKFNPSLGSAEGSIILPNRGCGKVLLKVSWVDCQTLDEHGNDHLLKEEDVVSQVANFIDAHAGEGPQRSNVMDCFRDSKVPRVEYQTDVHTRSPPVDASQSVTLDQQPLPVSRYIKMPRTLMEVFSVKFLEFNQRDFDQMYGCILMSLLPTYVVFSRKQGGPLNITPEGFVKLRGPNIAIEAYDPVLCIPHLFRYETSSDQFKDYDEIVCWGDEVIWNDRRRGAYDTFLSKRIPSRFGPIEVDFAVYKDGVEARVEVSLTGCQFASAVVYGCITAENSNLGERARSFLFNRDKSEGIRLDVSPYKDNIMKLPLSRSTTVHPIGSFVTITMNLWQSSIMGSQDRLIAKNETFRFTSLSGRDLRTFMGDECQVNVVVVWAKAIEPINIECTFV